MAVSYLAGGRIQGTEGERTGVTHFSKTDISGGGASVRPEGNSDRIEFVGYEVQSSENNKAVKTVQFYIARSSTFTNGQMWCRIFEDATGTPTTHDSVKQDITECPTSAAWITFTFSSPVTIQTGWVVAFGGDFGSQSNYVSIYFGANYDGGYTYILNSGTWVSYDGYGTAIKIQDEIPSWTNTPIASLYEETDTKAMYSYLYTYAGGATPQWTNEGGYLTEAESGGGARGIFCGGYIGAYINVMEYITISTTGNTTDFGDLTANRSGIAAGGNGTRGIMAGGYTSADDDVIEYITIANTGNSTDFGDLTVERSQPCGNMKSTAGRNVFAAGNAIASAFSNVMDYITVANTGNATDFGDSTIGAYGRSGGCNNGTRGCVAGGVASGSVRTNIIDYITMGTTGNATDFGDMSAATQFPGGSDNSSRGIFAGGYDSGYSNKLDYITIASTGNAADFGDMVEKRHPPYACNDLTRSIFSGGQGAGGGSGKNQNIEYITTATLGNGTNFGDMSAAKYDSVAGVDSST